MKSVNQHDLELVVVGWMKYVRVYRPVRPWVVAPHSSFRWKLKSDVWKTYLSQGNDSFSIICMRS